MTRLRSRGQCDEATVQLERRRVLSGDRGASHGSEVEARRFPDAAGRFGVRRVACPLRFRGSAPFLEACGRGERCGCCRDECDAQEHCAEYFGPLCSTGAPSNTAPIQAGAGAVAVQRAGGKQRWRTSAQSV